MEPGQTYIAYQLGDVMKNFRSNIGILIDGTTSPHLVCLTQTGHLLNYGNICGECGKISQATDYKNTLELAVKIKLLTPAFCMYT